MTTGSRVQAGATATGLLGGLNCNSPPPSRTTTHAPTSTATNPTHAVVSTMPSRPFDAVVAIGVLIKGQTMHFEYVPDAAPRGLTRTRLDTGVPVVFGVLAALTEDQALLRAGVGKENDKGHNHGENWCLAAVEMEWRKVPLRARTTSRVETKSCTRVLRRPPTNLIPQLETKTSFNSNIKVSQDRPTKTDQRFINPALYSAASSSRQDISLLYPWISSPSTDFWILLQVSRSPWKFRQNSAS